MRGARYPMSSTLAAPPKPRSLPSGERPPHLRTTGLPTAPQRDLRREASRTGNTVPLPWRLAALFLIILAAVLPRVIGVDRLVTPDEPIWLARSANFAEAIHSHHPLDTYQWAHPGVPVMWLGAIGYRIAAPDYLEKTSGQVSQRLNRIGGVLAGMGYDQLDVMVAGRMMVILAGVIVLAISYWISLRLLPFWPVTLGFLVIALDPFNIALTRLLHVDGLGALFSLLATVSALAWLARDRVHWMIVLSGVAGALAILTRVQLAVTCVFFLLLFVVAAFEAAGWRWPGLRRLWVEVGQPMILWGAAAFATAMLLWPAFAVSPIGTLHRMTRVVETATVTGHERSIFFSGLVYDGDPGWRFYPATFLWRATPALLVGLAMAMFVLLMRERWRIPVVQARIVMALSGSALFYTVVMSMAAKKFDRYLLPAYAPLMIVAAWGIVMVGRRVAHRFALPRWLPVAAFSALALAVQLQGVRATEPYYLPYYNPMLGGPEAATGEMMIGWGEGLDQVANWLNAQPGGDSLAVGTESWLTAISYFMDGAVHFAGYHPDRQGIFRWAENDFYVRYITPDQREGIPPEWEAVLAGREPVMTVTLNGLRYATLYDIRDMPVPSYLENGQTGMIEWPGTARFVAAGRDASTRILRGLPFTEVAYFDHLGPGVADGAAGLGLRLDLVAPDGTVVSSSDGPLELVDAGRHGLSMTSRRLFIPEDAMSGEYRVEAMLYDLETGEPLTGFERSGGSAATGPVGVHFFPLYDVIVPGAAAPAEEESAPVSEGNG